ncbi:MAG: thiamine-monophosphate kinase [Actinomycetia bacterium]|nr:thiamine-monophosphate kinase [Actinomycetes bacterium]MDQ1657017.1 thiamine-monophosphate kinase [Cryptosporangiaceae bacterium]
MTVSDTGEFGLLARIVPRLGTSAATLLGPGDDAAVLSAADGRVVATTDLLLEGRHFRQDWSGPYDIGRKAAAQNLADVVAMGATPTGLLVGLGCPADTPLEWAEQFADGLRDEAALVGVAVVGGDMARFSSIVISVTALGELHGLPPVTRSGARAGDLVAVAGRLGWSAGGYAVLSRGFRTPRTLVAAHQRPEPPYACGPAAARLGATAMCDVSDGLVADLGHIATASGVRIDLDSRAFRISGQMSDAAQALGVDPLRWVLTGGEDHALAATFPAGTELPEPWKVVGRVAEGEGVLVDGSVYPHSGYDHFQR